MPSVLNAQAAACCAQLHVSTTQAEWTTACDEVIDLQRQLEELKEDLRQSTEAATPRAAPTERVGNLPSLSALLLPSQLQFSLYCRTVLLGAHIIVTTCNYFGWAPIMSEGSAAVCCNGPFHHCSFQSCCGVDALVLWLLPCRSALQHAGSRSGRTAIPSRC